MSLHFGLLSSRKRPVRVLGEKDYKRGDMSVSSPASRSLRRHRRGGRQFFKEHPSPS
jgi:hypothetical protein